MIFYANTGDYSDADRYERFALDCKLGEKAFEIGSVVKYLVGKILNQSKSIEILETASATGLTAVGVTEELVKVNIKHTYTSLDIEQNLLCYAEARKRGDNFIQDDFENLPFTDNAFDIYIVMGAGGYRPKGTFYPEVRRVLKVGGYYIMPQIGPRSFTSTHEKDRVLNSGLIIVQKNNYLIAQNI